MNLAADSSAQRWSVTELPSFQAQNKRRRLNTIGPNLPQAHLARVEESKFCPRRVPVLAPLFPWPSTYTLPYPVGTADPDYSLNPDHVPATELPRRAEGVERQYDELVHQSALPSAQHDYGGGFEAQDRIGSYHLSTTNGLQTRHHLPSRQVGFNYLTQSPIGIMARLASAEGVLEAAQSLTQTDQPQHTSINGTGRSNLERASIRNIVDEEGLDVDDPRRSYDFLDFITDWRLCCTEDTVIPFKNEPQLPEASDYVTSTQVLEEHLDMQGLRWTRPGVNREAALRTRKQLHPSGRHEGLLQPPGRLRNDTSRLYNFRSFHPKHKAHPSHYQLRNVLTSMGRSEIFYAIRHQIVQTTLACPDVQTTVMDLAGANRTVPPVKITCLSTPQGCYNNKTPNSHVLFAGGFTGEYAMLDLTSPDTPLVIEGFVTHEYNGIVNHISTSPNRKSGLLEATFCSNDQKVRILDVKTQKFTTTTSYEYAMNCSAISPDGRLRLLVGDSNETLICNADGGESLVTLKSHTDHAFACAWSPNDTIVATGAQDGRILLWDARNWSRALQTLHAAMSCARSLRFADDGTLVVAESEDVVSFYHPREEDIRQDIRFFGSIAGVSLLDGGAEVVVANADRTVGGLLTLRRAESWNERSVSYESQSDTPSENYVVV